MTIVNNPTNPKKIIHIDMDCFFVAIEVRDNPTLRSQPVAVGGTPAQRGVLSTCNYEARKYGVHSAMPTAQALKICPRLILLPVNMQKYQAASKALYRIFRQYTPLVEMLSLDEAFLDVSRCQYCKGSATLIAETIKRRIKKELGLSASAGVAPNKFLAKVASDWNKPNGVYVITPKQVDSFVRALPITKIFGVGKVTAEKLHNMQIRTCYDLQQLALPELVAKFGKIGNRFYQLCRGIDDREVEPESIRKSLSVEETFPRDIQDRETCLTLLPQLIKKLKSRLASLSNLIIVKQFVKIKFSDFKLTTVERRAVDLEGEFFYDLFQVGFSRHNKAIRLIGVGVGFRG
jgi:DNA polymerase-4